MCDGLGIIAGSCSLTLVVLLHLTNVLLVCYLSAGAALF